ncbi:MAG: tetratricopeptide repeat protein, partial [Myxococcota bacterium]
MRIFSRNYLAVSVALLGLACGQAEDPLIEIRKLHEEGRYAATIDQLRTLVDQNPSRAETQFLLGAALLFSGNGGLAVWPLRAAAQAPEYAIEGRMLLVQSMLESRTAPDAIPVIAEILEIEPENTAAIVLRIQAYQASGRNEDALVDIERVLELEPENAAVMVPRVTALIATEQIDEAEKAIEDARELLDSAEGEVNPSFVAMLCVARGLFAHEKGDSELAEAQYAECLEKFPVNPFVVQEAANFYGMTGQRERAIEILEKALEESGNSAFRMALAERMKRAGDTEEQERLLRAEAEEQPSINSWFRLADFYVGRDEFDKALEAFDHSLARSADPPESLLFAYADTLVQAEQFDKARSIVMEFKESALRDLIIGRILLAQGDPAAALVSFEAGILLWPNNPAGRFLAGQAAERIGDFDRAISEYKESMRANPARSTAALELAELDALRGRYDEAIEAVKRHMQAHPGDIDGIIAAVRIAHKAGRYGVASEGLDRLAEMPEHGGTAVAEHATLLALRSPEGAATGVKTVEESDVDLTDPVNA